MSCGDLRRPQVDIVPVLFAQLDIEVATVEALAATYCCKTSTLEAALEAGSAAGYLVKDDDAYVLTRSGRNATMKRGGAKLTA